MKKIFTIIESVILSLILTFILAELFSLYHFGSIPTTLTTIYLISLFSIFEYLILSIIYIVIKIKDKEKITSKRIISMFLFFISLLLILYFFFATDVDWLNYYSKGNSAPFYLTIIENGIKILVPSIISFVIGMVLVKKMER